MFSVCCFLSWEHLETTGFHSVGPLPSEKPKNISCGRDERAEGKCAKLYFWANDPFKTLSRKGLAKDCWTTSKNCKKKKRVISVKWKKSTVLDSKIFSFLHPNIWISSCYAENRGRGKCQNRGNNRSREIGGELWVQEVFTPSPLGLLQLSVKGWEKPDSAG